MPADARIPIVLGIDVEPDNRDAAPGAGVEAEGFRRTTQALDALRTRLAEATGASVQFAWYVRMDPQVADQGGRPDAILSAAPLAVASIEASADVIGLHTHAGRWESTRRVWVSDHGDPTWIDHCLVSSFAAFEQRFGRSCREHRFGDRFSSQAVFERLAGLGATVDLTIEPGQLGRARPPHVAYATGRVPSYVDAPSSVRRVAGGTLALLPLSSADPAPSLSRSRRWLRRLRYAGQPRRRTLLLDRTWPTPDLFWDLAEEQLELGAHHLAFVLRSDTILTARWSGVAAVLEAVPRRELARRLAFVGAEAAARAAAKLAATG